MSTDSHTTTTVLAGAAILSTTAAHYLSSLPVELGAEALGWTALAVVFNLFRYYPAGGPSQSIVSLLVTSRVPPPPRIAVLSALAALAAACGVAVYAFCCGEGEVTKFLPALTPLLLLAQRHIHNDPLQTTNPPRTWSLSFLSDTARGTVAVAVLAILSLPSWNYSEYAFSAGALAALLAVYLLILPRSVNNSHHVFDVDVQHGFASFSIRAVVTLSMILAGVTVKYGGSQGGLLHVLILGLAKAASWFCLLQLAQHASWPIVGAVQVFGIVATRTPSNYPSEIYAIAHLLVAACSIGQVIHMLPKNSTSRSLLWGLMLLPIVPRVSHTITAGIMRSGASHGLGQELTHPVELLADRALSQFEDLLAKQSQDFTAAQDEYRRRYSIEPPPGFRAWYDYAKASQSLIIDDYDIIFDAVSPFLELSGQDIQQLLESTQGDLDEDMWLCRLSGADGVTKCHHPFRGFDRNVGRLFNTIVKNIPGNLPNVTFLVNYLDEPRVLLPSSAAEAPFLTELSHQSTWKNLTKHCDKLHSPKVAGRERSPIETHGLPFVTDKAAAMNLCKHPEFRDMHGLFASPASFRLIDGFVPVLSTGTVSTMGDILFPSPAYIEDGFRYDDSASVAWEDKRNNLYWAGSSTGGYAAGNSWLSFQRQRFLELSQNLGWQSLHYLRETNGIVSRIASSFLDTSLYDVSLTRILQCETPACRNQRRHFKTTSWAGKDEMLHSRLVFDVDGNGISGRYYKLLASRSCPLKQTLFREWHDDRLFPWVHYVPVSQGLGELPELVSWLTSTDEGQRRARMIAEQGREWHGRALREVDIGVYLYRLMLELARLQDPERPAG